ncbi:TRAP transporter substrate-binding protein [Oceanobacillus massiliensis]|uniref:TRAP transporter substrate-binding protein n=1 Tax=Oceanobacillus massiliensis TaxID=1465765 RepID=UPI000288808B|nr:TRAP transporter substrate-binding protein [Oceanobacillus massiliensis]
MKKILFVLMFLLVIQNLAGCENVNGKTGQKQLKLAHNQPLDHPVHKSLAEFGRLVEEKSNHAIQVEIYPNGQLGSEREVIELTQTGAVDISKVSASALEGFDPNYSVFSLPYLFEDYAAFQEVMGDPSISDHVYQLTENIGFIGLTYYNSGVRNLYTKNREVHELSDMKGLKVRVQPSQTSVRMIESLGGIPTAMSYSEVYTALQSGVIDAAENNATTLVGNNHGEVAKYYMYTEHQIVPDILIMNAKRLKQFSDEERLIIEKSAQESTLYHEDVWSKAIQEETEIAKNEMGVEFIEVDKQPFIDAVQPLHNEYAKSDQTKELYQLLKGGSADE